MNESIKIGEQSIIESLSKKCWKSLCGNHNIKWSKALIDKYQTYINWDSLSSNISIEWTFELVDSYKEKLNWIELTKTLLGYVNFRHSNIFTNLDWLEKYQELIDWDNLSEHGWDITEEIVLKFTSKWNWEKLINNNGMKWTTELFSQIENSLINIDQDLIHSSEMIKQLNKRTSS